MLSTSGSLRPGRPLIGIAVGGMVLGHVLGYLIAFPAQALRAEHLAATGHGSFSAVAMLALAVAGGSILVVGARAVREGGDVAVAPATAQLVRLQVPAFLLLELIERGWDPARTLADPGVRVGLVIQALVAVAIAALLGTLVRGVRALASAARPSWPRPASLPLPFPRRTPSPRPTRHLGSRRRAPPHPLVPELC